MIDDILNKRKYDGMDERAKAKYEQLENKVADEGYVNNKVYGSSKHGYGDFDSFFDILVECRLSGDKYPTSQQVFENMKKQINNLRSELHKASEDYVKLENECRHLRKEKEELIKINNI